MADHEEIFKVLNKAASLLKDSNSDLTMFDVWFLTPVMPEVLQTLGVKLPMQKYPFYNGQLHYRLHEENTETLSYQEVLPTFEHSVCKSCAALFVKTKGKSLLPLGSVTYFAARLVRTVKVLNKYTSEELNDLGVNLVSYYDILEDKQHHLKQTLKLPQPGLLDDDLCVKLHAEITQKIDEKFENVKKVFTQENYILNLKACLREMLPAPLRPRKKKSWEQTFLVAIPAKRGSLEQRAVRQSSPTVEVKTGSWYVYVKVDGELAELLRVLETNPAQEIKPEERTLWTFKIQHPKMQGPVLWVNDTVMEVAVNIHEPNAKTVDGNPVPMSNLFTVVKTAEKLCS